MVSVASTPDLSKLATPAELTLTITPPVAVPPNEITPSTSDTEKVDPSTA